MHLLNHQFCIGQMKKDRVMARLERREREVSQPIDSSRQKRLLGGLPRWRHLDGGALVPQPVEVHGGAIAGQPGHGSFVMGFHGVALGAATLYVIAAVSAGALIPGRLLPP